MRSIFSDAQVADFLRRSYFAVDGLWFVKTEETRGFEDALELDVAVWDVMSKIQARKAKQLLGIQGDSLELLAQAFQLKLTAEGYDFDLDLSKSEARFTMRLCPWYEILKTSNRTHISESITNRICMMEFSGWIREFSPDIDFEMRKRMCIAADNCSQCEIAFLTRAKQ